MMRVLWEEWRGASAYTTRIVPLLALGAALALLVTRFQPGSLFLVLVLAGLAGGVVSGTQRWNQLRARDWVGEEGTAPLTYALGKIGGLLLVVAAWAAFLAPLFVLLTLTWGLPLGVALQGVLWSLAATISAQAVGHAVTWSTSEFQRFFGAVLVFLWTAFSLQFSWLRPLNPLWQVWTLFHDTGAVFDTVSFFIVLGGSGALWAAVLLFLRREVSR